MHENPEQTISRVSYGQFYFDRFFPLIDVDEDGHVEIPLPDMAARVGLPSRVEDVAKTSILQIGPGLPASKIIFGSAVLYELHHGTTVEEIICSAPYVVYEYLSPESRRKTFQLRAERSSTMDEDAQRLFNRFANLCVRVIAVRDVPGGIHRLYVLIPSEICQKAFPDMSSFQRAVAGCVDQNYISTPEESTP